MRRLTFLGLALLSAHAALAQMPLPLHVVPLVAGTAGWRTEVTVANLSPRPVPVGLRLFPEGRAGTFDGTFARTLTLAAGETRTLDTTAAAPAGRRGWLLVADATPIDCAGRDWPYPALLAVSAQLRHGTTTTAVQVDWLRANVTAAPSVIVVPGGGVAPGAAPLLQVGVANIATTSLPVRVELFAPDGRAVGSVLREVAALSQAVWSLADMVPGAARPARIEVTAAVTTDPCTLAKLPPPCADPCDRTACPQRYRLPAAPAFFAFALAGSAGSLTYLAPVVDHVGAQRVTTAAMAGTCPDVNATARLLDLFGKLVLLRQTPTFRKVEPAPGR